MVQSEKWVATLRCLVFSFELVARNFVRRQLIRASFWEKDVSDTDVGISYQMDYSDNNYPIDDVTSLSTQAMMSQAPFLDAGWHFDSVWAIEEALGYPVFQWEFNE